MNFNPQSAIFQMWLDVIGRPGGSTLTTLTAPAVVVTKARNDLNRPMRPRMLWWHAGRQLNPPGYPIIPRLRSEPDEKIIGNAIWICLTCVVEAMIIKIQIVNDDRNRATEF